MRQDAKMLTRIARICRKFKCAEGAGEHGCRRVNSQMWSRKPGQVSLASRKFVQFASLLGDLCVLCVLLRLKTLRVVHYYLAGVRKRNPRIQSGPEFPLPDRHNLRK